MNAFAAFLRSRLHGCRGLAPLAVLLAGVIGAAPARAQTPQSVSVPLYHVIDADGNYRLGFYAALGTSNQFKLYELDTGSSGTYAAYNQKWWPSYRFVTGNTTPQVYESGFQFNSDTVATIVDLGGGARTRAPVNVGKITSASGPGLVPGQWAAIVKAGQPPLHGVFFGNMGSGLGTKNKEFAVLAQMPGNLASGFIIRTRGYIPNQQSGAPIQQGEIILGLTAKLRAQFEIQIPIAPNITGGRIIKFPSGYLTREQYGITLNLTLSDKDAGTYATSLIALLDSGAPSTTLYEHTPNVVIPAGFLNGDGAKTHIKSGTLFGVADAGTGRQAFDWKFLAGDTASFNKVGVSANKSVGENPGEINLGIAPYFAYDVMFDIKNGILGLHRLSPLPVVTVTPAAKSVITAKSAYAVSGMATSPLGIQNVAYQVGSQGVHTATGTVRWRFKAKLAGGNNKISIWAYNTNGQATKASLTIRRVGGAG